MSTVVFLGSSLPRALVPPQDRVELRPPAAMGDIARAVSEGHEAVVLIDGVFEDRPSVWHKEILWALSRGVAVIGAASMGALRAAELDSLGMLGQGEVYAAYAAGVFTDDDEVAVIHGPAETGYLPLSDAMVDIRDAAALAVKEGVVTASEAAAIIACAKARYFKERSLAAAAHATLRHCRTGRELADALAWFGTERPGVKARDALMVLHDLDRCQDLARRRAASAGAFAPTVYLRRLEPFGYRAD